MAWHEYVSARTLIFLCTISIELDFSTPSKLSRHTLRFYRQCVIALNLRRLGLLSKLLFLSSETSSLSGELAWLVLLLQASVIYSWHTPHRNDWTRSRLCKKAKVSKMPYSSFASWENFGIHRPFRVERCVKKTKPWALRTGASPLCGRWQSRSLTPPPSSRRFDQICIAIIVLYKESLSVHHWHQSNSTDIRVQWTNHLLSGVLSDLINMQACAVFVSLAIACFDLVAAQGSDYCRISRSHTMCQYQVRYCSHEWEGFSCRRRNWFGLAAFTFFYYPKHCCHLMTKLLTKVALLDSNRWRHCLG